MGKFLDKMYNKAANMNRDNIADLLDVNPRAKFLDIGCDDGVWTMKCADRVTTKDVHGVDVVEERLEMARKLNVDARKADILDGLPYEENTFDAIMSNQVIEHVGNVDKYITEVHRVLKSGGYAVISTENASSWINVFAVAMGWQMFSLTNLSSTYMGLGNPLAQWRGKKLDLPSWSHKTIFSYRGLKEFFEVYGFEVIDLYGAGYFPAPARIGRVDPRHAHFITIKVRKK